LERAFGTQNSAPASLNVFVVGGFVTHAAAQTCFAQVEQFATQGRHLWMVKLDRPVSDSHSNTAAVFVAFGHTAHSLLRRQYTGARARVKYLFLLNEARGSLLNIKLFF
jgi:hypothetical protein